MNFSSPLKVPLSIDRAENGIVTEPCKGSENITGYGSVKRERLHASTVYALCACVCTLCVCAGRYYVTHVYVRTYILDHDCQFMQWVHRIIIDSCYGGCYLEKPCFFWQADSSQYVAVSTQRLISGH